MRIYDLKINGLINPRGFRYDSLICSWKICDTNAKKQNNAKIEVSKSENFDDVVYMKEGKNLTSIGEKIKMELVPYTTYYYRITVTGDNGETAVSNTCFFETGKLNTLWEAEWIGPLAEDTFHPEVVREFAVTKEVKRARLYICGLGVFEAYINGKKVGDDYLAPFINDYKTSFQYMTYDISELISNENNITVLLGDGWYKGRLGFEGKRNIFGDRYAVIAELRLEYSDGSREVINTNENWKYRRSMIQASDIYDGETIDYLLYKDSENLFKHVDIIPLPKDKLCARYSMVVKEKEEVKVKEVIITPAGETVLDMGQNFTGYMEYKSSLPSGTVIALDFGEVLQNGNFYNDNYRSAKSQLIYVSDGENRIVRPHFTFYGFRYVRVTGWPQEVNPDDFTGKAVYSDLDRTGYVETSDSKINQLYSNSVWGLKSNFLDMPTDCPQRDERLGWTGDAQVFASTASYHMDTRAFYNKFLIDLRYDQMRHNGAVANFIPNFMEGMSCSVWGDIATFMPTALFQYYGDQDALERYYPLMKSWVDYIHEEDEKQGTHNLYDWGFHFGDWLALDGISEQSVKGATDDYYIASVYYYASALKVAEAAKILGKAEEEMYYRNLSLAIKDAIFHEYYSPSGRLTIDTQTAYLVALKFGVYINKDKIINGLKQRFKKDCYRIKGGFVGATMMCTVLAENQMEDLAYDFLFFEGFPGWLRSVNLSATTIWERWNSILDDGSISGTGMNSLNHYAYGSVMEFVYRYTAGIRQLKPGFTEAIIAPILTTRLRYVHCTYDSVAGKYISNWNINDDGTLSFHIEIPFNCSAKVRLPDYEKEELTLEAGIYDFTYLPSRDYNVIFNPNSKLEQMIEHEEARKILQEKLPQTSAFIDANDKEYTTMTLEELKSITFMGFEPEVVQAVAEEIYKIRN